MEFFRKHKSMVFGFTIFVFVLGTVAGLASYFFDKRTDSICSIDGQYISKKLFQSSLNGMANEVMAKEKKTSLSDQELNGLKSRALSSLVQTFVINRYASNINLNVTDSEILFYIANTSAFQVNQKFNQQRYYTVLWQSLGKRPRDYEAELKDNILARKTISVMASLIKVSKTELEYEGISDASMLKNTKINTLVGMLINDMIKNSKIVILEQK